MKNLIKKLNDKIPKYKGFKATGSVTTLSLTLIIVVLMGYFYGSYQNELTAHAQTVIVLAEVKEYQHKQETELKEALAELETYKAKHPDPKREEIESYVRKIFGKDANVALAVSHHECGYTNKHYPRCHLKSGVEHSVGLFQINLYNSKQWIHAGRIPGVTMEEKVKWLENPFNNTLYAYWVFKTSGFNPWTAYSKGAYLNDPLIKGSK